MAASGATKKKISNAGLYTRIVKCKRTKMEKRERDTN